MAQNQLAKAIQGLDKLLAFSHPIDHRDFQLKILGFRAIAYWLDGQSVPALADIRRAVLWAAPAEYRRVFLAHGEPMLLLLRELLGEWSMETAVSPHTKQFLKQLIHLLGAADAQSNQQSQFTDRERDVLQLLANGMTYAAIAKRLVVSENTVRTHIKNIYSKLNVHNRTKALEQAAALNLIQQ